MNISFFKTSNWANASCDERRNALQALENYFAGVQGRNARTVKEAALEENVLGLYSTKEPSQITINKELIKSSFGNFMAMDTIIHEGRHAYQDDCIMWRSSPCVEDTLKVLQWRTNMPGRGGEYFNPDEKKNEKVSRKSLLYWSQPIEMDAHGYAHRQMHTFGDFFADDFNYAAFRQKITEDDKYLTDKATTMLGEDFEEFVAQAVSEMYKDSCLTAIGISQTVNTGAAGETGTEIVSISTAEVVTKIRSVLISSERLAAVITDASQELIRKANYLAQITRGSRSGEEATSVIRVSAQSLNAVVATIHALARTGEDYIQNAIN